VVNRSNPFEARQIKKIAVPVFINRSIFPQVEGKITQQVRQVLKKYDGLTLTTSDAGNSSDAVLVGIIESPVLARNTKTLSNYYNINTQEGANRRSLVLPRRSQYNLTVRFILIYRPTEEELDLVKGDLAKHLVSNGKILFNYSLNGSGAYDLSLGNNVGPNGIGAANATNNLAKYHLSVDTLAVSIAGLFEQTIINVF